MGLSKALSPMLIIFVAVPTVRLLDQQVPILAPYLEAFMGMAPSWQEGDSEGLRVEEDTEKSVLICTHRGYTYMSTTASLFMLTGNPERDRAVRLYYPVTLPVLSRKMVQ